MAKEVLALDIDDVAVKHIEGFVRWSNTTLGTNLTLGDYSEAWHELWDTDTNETEARKKLFFTEDIIGAFEPIDGAGEGIAKLSTIRRVVGVTSRRESLQRATETTLELLAPGAVDRIIFATRFNSNGEKITRSKADICREIGAKELIDDQPKNCNIVGAIGIRAILFGDYLHIPEDIELGDHVERAKNWSEVMALFNIKK